MSGLFLNFYQVEIPYKKIIINTIDYNTYADKESFIKLKEENYNQNFYRYDNKILVWNNLGDEIALKNLVKEEFDLKENPKIFSKIFEVAFIEFIKAKDHYQIFKNKYSNTWEIKSSINLLNEKIEGLVLNRIVHFSPCFFFKENKILFGFTLSTSLKNNFTWHRKDFEKNGIDTKGLKGNPEKIFANRQSIKRFNETKGTESLYNNIIERENTNFKCFEVIDKFYGWLNKNRTFINLPFDLKINSISKKYLPLEDELIKAEIINKPQRFFYSNRKNIQKLRYYDEMVKTYQPYSLELYQNRNINFGVICPLEYQGETEVFLKKIENKLKEVFHLNLIKFYLKTIVGKGLENYKEVLYDSDLLKCDLIYIIVDESQKKLSPELSPYYTCKAKFIGNGIPTQDIQIETIRRNLTTYTMSNISLNTYAKLGGTAWTIEKEDKLRDELIIGIGSTISDNGQFILGIAQIFHNDGRYMTGDCSPLSTFDNYSKNLENHLFKTLSPIVENMGKVGNFRLIFHLYKSASEEYEIRAIENLKKRLDNYNFEFALIHLSYGHNFRLYFNEGKNGINQGTYIQLSAYSALLHFVSKSDLPLKIDLDKRSTFTSLFYITKQVYYFSHLSHRSYIPAKRTVTIMYPSIMAKITEELKKVEGWDYERLKAVSEKLWFI